MELSGGYYGGYEYLGDQIQSGETILPANQTQITNEFYVIDDNGIRYFYRVDLDCIVFIGVNL